MTRRHGQVSPHCGITFETDRKNHLMQEMLQHHGSSEQVSQAEQDLPDQVDTNQHAGLLSNLGVNPQELLTK